VAKRRTQAQKSDAATRKVRNAALALFSRQGYRATSMRQIATRSGLSVGNLYHHFGSKETIFQGLIDDYWKILLDAELPLNKIFAAARFPDDMEEMAAAIEQVVGDNSRSILLIYIDVIEFRGKHIKAFYQQMADRFSNTYAESLARRQREGELGETDPLVAVMLATRWFFYFFTVEKCFGVPMHFGLDAHQAVGEFANILRFGVFPRPPGEGVRSGLKPIKKAPLNAKARRGGNHGK
jgi:AcrR family transcriptional regulator